MFQRYQIIYRQSIIADLQWKEYPLILRSHDVSCDLLHHLTTFILMFQVEYCYPPFNEGSSPESPQLPTEWKHLPSLALPDGAHNYVEGLFTEAKIIFKLLTSKDRKVAWVKYNFIVKYILKDLDIDICHY